MLSCFNEGFSDEESIAATFSQVPKVYLSFNHGKSYTPDFPEPNMSQSAFSFQTLLGCPTMRISDKSLPTTDQPNNLHYHREINENSKSSSSLSAQSSSSGSFG